MIRYLSFDLQGVLSAADFSDAFWLEELPKLYATKHGLSLTQAKTSLQQQFAAMGTYDTRYYDNAYWEQQLGFSTRGVLQAMLVQPTINYKLLHFIRSRALPAVLLTTTTTIFVDYELGDAVQLFEQVFSCIDTFGTGGKTPAVYRRIAQTLGVEPHEILHIGDNDEMDIHNADAAGVRTIRYNANDRAVIQAMRQIIDDAGHTS
jgi:FMN phosphatase YigB (HAD superfamily)